MDEEVVDSLHQSVGVSLRLIANPREQVVDDFLEAVFQLCP
jgi:hypothetical protein